MATTYAVPYTFCDSSINSLFINYSLLERPPLFNTHELVNIHLSHHNIPILLWSITFHFWNSLFRIYKLSRTISLKTSLNRRRHHLSSTWNLRIICRYQTSHWVFCILLQDIVEKLSMILLTYLDHEYCGHWDWRVWR